MSVPLDRGDRERAAAALEVDPGRSNIVLCVGTKGSGKSEAGRLLFDSWEFDRAMIDITGDARPDDPFTVAMTAPFPPAMPEPAELYDEEQLEAMRRQGRERATLWLRVDPRSPTLDLDHDLAMAVGLFPRHRPALVMVDEYGRMATATSIPPNVDLALMSSRHYHLTLVLCCPRPMRIPVLTIGQADKVLIFDTPKRDDRRVLADNMGYPFERFETAYAATMARGDHSYLLWDKRQKLLLGCPPLPLAATHGPRA